MRRKSLKANVIVFTILGVIWFIVIVAAGLVLVGLISNELQRAEEEIDTNNQVDEMRIEIGRLKNGLEQLKVHSVS